MKLQVALAAEEFHPFFFLLPDHVGLLEYLLLVELAWLVAMAVYGFALRKLVRNPRDSVVVFHRIFWRMFTHPKKTATLEAYDKPVSIAGLDDFDAPILDGLGDTSTPEFIGHNDDTAGGTALGAAVGGTGLGMAAGDVEVDVLGADFDGDFDGGFDEGFDGPPPEPEPISIDDAGEVELNIELLPNAPALGVQGMVGDTLTLRVPCGAEDGIANRHVVNVLCQVLGVESYQVTLIRGHAKGSKTFRLTGMSLPKVQQRMMSIAK